MITTRFKYQLILSIVCLFVASVPLWWYQFLCSKPYFCHVFDFCATSCSLFLAADDIFSHSVILTFAVFSLCYWSVKSNFLTDECHQQHFLGQVREMTLLFTAWKGFLRASNLAPKSYRYLKITNYKEHTASKNFLLILKIKSLIWHWNLIPICVPFSGRKSVARAYGWNVMAYSLLFVAYDGIWIDLNLLLWKVFLKKWLRPRKKLKMVRSMSLQNHMWQEYLTMD